MSELALPGRCSVMESTGLFGHYERCDLPTNFRNKDSKLMWYCKSHAEEGMLAGNQIERLPTETEAFAESESLGPVYAE